MIFQVGAIIDWLDITSSPNSLVIRAPFDRSNDILVHHLDVTQKSVRCETINGAVNEYFV